MNTITSSKAEYFRYLTHFYGGFLEANLLLNWPLLASQGLPDIERRRERYVNLMSDLIELNENSEPIPPFPTVESDSNASLATTVGALYVLEGSVHGGMQILKQLEANLPQIRPIEVTFLRGFGADTVTLWKSFCVWLNGVHFSPTEQQNVCQSAIDTFSIFQKHFSSSRSRP